MFKAFVPGALIAFGLVLGGKTMASGSTQRSSNTPANNPKDDKKIYEEELPDATPVERGVLTDRQRAHSKRFADYATRMPGMTLMDLVTNAKANNDLIVTAHMGIGIGPMPRSGDADHFFDRITNTSDAIIIGKISKKVSQITEDDHFLFTDYDVQILEVIKDNASRPISAHSNVVVTRPGGKVLLNGVIIMAQDDDFLPLPIGKEVLLFLSFIPETGAYQTFYAISSFELTSAEVRPLTKVWVPRELVQSRSILLQVINGILAKRKDSFLF